MNANNSSVFGGPCINLNIITTQIYRLLNGRKGVFRYPDVRAPVGYDIGISMSWFWKIFLNSCLDFAVRCFGCGPFRNRFYCIHKIMYYVRMTIFDPSSLSEEVPFAGLITNDTVFADKIGNPGQVTKCDIPVFFAPASCIKHGSYSTKGRIDATPWIIVGILFPHNGNSARTFTSHIFHGKLDAMLCMLFPLRIERFFLLNQVPGHVKRGPGIAVILFWLIFKKLNPQAVIPVLGRL